MYQLDANAARHADTAGATIKEIGKYVGEFVQAKDVVTKKGGRGIDSAGYVRVTLPDGRRVREHRLVAAEMLGRPPLPTEHVHHGNENKQDNAPTNLEVLAPSEHARIHAPSVSPNPFHRAKRAKAA